MRSEDDLRLAIASLADRAPRDAVARLQLPAPVQRPRHTRRQLALAATAAVVIVAIGLGFALRTTEASPADQRVPGNWQMISSVEPVPGWRVVRRGIDGTSEFTALSDEEGPGATCSLIAYGRGAAPAGGATGQPVRVGDRPGTYTPATAQDAALVTWAYDDDAYAQVVCLADRSEDQMIRLARAARFDRSVDLPVPFRLGELPDGYRPESVESIEQDGFTTVGVRLTSTGRPTISVVNAAAPFDPPAQGSAVFDVLINGRTTSVRADELALSIDAGDGYVRVRYDASADSFEAGEQERLMTIAQGLRLAESMSDTGTWFTARQAFG